MCKIYGIISDIQTRVKNNYLEQDPSLIFHVFSYYVSYIILHHDSVADLIELFLFDNQEFYRFSMLS